MNAETRIPPRQEQVDALLGDELAVSEKSQNFVPKDELGLMGIDVGDGMSFVSAVPNSSGNHAMNVRVPIERRAECLTDGNHPDGCFSTWPWRAVTSTHTQVRANP